MIKAKRFWKDVSVEAGFSIALDGRAVKTPAKNTLILPTRELAEAVAEEWRAVPDEAEIDPSQMPMTRMANSAQERIPRDRAEVEAHLAAYVQNDLLCYRAAQPAALVEMQKAWDEWLEWVRGCAIKLEVTEGIMPIAQADENIAVAAVWLGKFDDHALVAIHDLIGILGSFVLAMAVAEGALELEAALQLSRIDEDYQISEWGADEEAEAVRLSRTRDIRDAWRFYRLCQSA